MRLNSNTDTSVSIERATTSTIMNRERKRRTRVGAAMCASRCTSSSMIVWPSSSVATATVRIAMAFRTPLMRTAPDPSTGRRTCQRSTSANTISAAAQAMNRRLITR